MSDEFSLRSALVGIGRHVNIMTGARREDRREGSWTRSAARTSGAPEYIGESLFW
jgi:hypothetical protein